MIDRTRLLFAAEFKQKSRWSSVWPNMRYGAMYLNYSVGRQLPMRGVNWVTRDSNRLTNFSDRYSSVIADIDTKRTEEELNLPLSDIRWNDHRRIYWTCSFCGFQYRKSVSVRTKFHAGCGLCKGRDSSEVLGPQCAAQPLAESEAAAELLPQLRAVGPDAAKNIAGLGLTSKFSAEWSCRGCGEPYRASIRSRTGQVAEGQCPLHPQAPAWTALCPQCVWAPNMKGIAAEVQRTGQFLGLEQPQGKQQQRQQQQQQRIPRRKRLVS